MRLFEISEVEITRVKCISNSRMSRIIFDYLCLIEISVINENSIDPDQMPRSVVSGILS